jgi:hypothetical protein
MQGAHLNQCQESPLQSLGKFTSWAAAAEATPEECSNGGDVPGTEYRHVD